MPRKFYKRCTAKDGSDYRTALSRSAVEPSLAEILNKVLNDVRKGSEKSLDQNVDPPFLVTKNPSVFTGSSASSQDQQGKPSKVTVAYNGPSGSGCLETGQCEFLQEDKAQAQGKIPPFFSSTGSDQIEGVTQEVMQQEVVEQEIVVEGEGNLDFHVIETFNVDEIPRAEEMVEIVESQPEHVPSAPSDGETQSGAVQIGISMDSVEDPILSTALQQPVESFSFRLLNYYSLSPYDHSLLWADETVPADSVGRSDPASYLATYTAHAEEDSSCSSQNISTTQCDFPPSAYICPECRSCFSLLHQFQDHLLTHPDPQDKKFLCQFCGKRFLRADHLNRHAMLHKNVKVFKCRVCGEEFGRASHLDKHRRRVHTRVESPLTKGSSIQSESKSSEGSNLHLLAAVASPEGRGSQGGNLGGEIVHGSHIPVARVEETVIAEGYQEFEDSLVASSSEQEQDRPHQCDQCGRRFFRITHLRRHRRIHTGERPFLCHICGRRYARGDYLRAHIQAHRKEKVHKCKVCGEVFLDLVRFSEHCRSHSQEEFDLADAKSERKPGRATNYLSNTKEYPTMMMGDLGEIVSMVTVPTSEEVVIGDEANAISSIGTDISDHNLPQGSYGGRGQQDSGQRPNEGALRSLFQDASKNVNLQEALLSLGSMSSSQIEALLSVASSIVGLTGGTVQGGTTSTQPTSYNSQTPAVLTSQPSQLSQLPQMSQPSQVSQPAQLPQMPQPSQISQAGYVSQQMQPGPYTSQQQQAVPFSPQHHPQNYTLHPRPPTEYSTQHQFLETRSLYQPQPSTLPTSQVVISDVTRSSAHVPTNTTTFSNYTI